MGLNTTFQKKCFSSALLFIFLSITITSFSQVLDVKGNNISIANNDSSPSITDFTDFGTIPTGNKLVKTFIVSNIGTSNLTFSSAVNSRIILGGTNADQFKINVGVGLNTTPLILIPNTYVYIEVSFNPTSTGLKTATVTIGSNNLGDSTYTFTIQGTASSAVTPTFTRTTMIPTFNYPYAILYGPDDYLWIIERAGKKVNRVNKTTGSVDELLDLSAVVYQSAAQDGLMGLTLHPKLGIGAGEINQVFLAYTYLAADNSRRMKIVRYDYTVTSNDGQLSNPYTVLEGLTANNDHNSAKLVYGPDNKLYFTVGDNGSNQGNTNNRCSLVRSQEMPTLAMLNASPPDYINYQGKSLRINLDGSIPNDNPVINGIKSHIFTLGHRNASGLTFGKNGKLYSSEHGARVDDELNILEAGKNYGWPNVSGFIDDKNYKYLSLHYYSINNNVDCSTITTANNYIENLTNQYGQLESSWTGTNTDPITTLGSTIDAGFNSSNGVYTWPTVAPSNVKIYEGFAAEIPGWNNSILTTTLKNGRVYRQKLSPDGSKAQGNFEELFETLNRYRDIAIDPDGKTFYLITDSGGNTSVVISGTTTQPVVDMGKILVFRYNEPTLTCFAPTIASLPTITSSCSVASLTAPTAANNCTGVSGILGYTETVFPITTPGNTIVVWKYDLGNGQIQTQNQTVTINGTIWNGIAWSNGEPLNQAALITADYTISKDMAACSLTLTNNATVSVNSGINVTLNGPLTISSGSFTLNNSANLLQTTNAINSGTIIVQRDSAPLTKVDYTLWSSPVSNQKLSDFSPQTATNQFYSYGTNANSYTAINNPTAINFVDGQGYSIQLPVTHSTSPTVWKGSFIGVPHNGNYSTAMTDGGTDKRFNLVGNPYPSPINMTQFVADNSTSIAGTLYFYRKNKGSGTAYSTWTDGIFVTNSKTQITNPNGIIQTGQGFFVEALQAATNVQFNNGQRVVNNAGQFFKNKQFVTTKNAFWLNASNASGDFSQIAIAYSPTANTGRDSFDGSYINDSAFALNSTINNEDYVIQSRPAPLDVTDSVPLSFKTNIAGNYTIALDHTEGTFSAAQDIVLLDKTIGVETNLKTSSYNFTASAGIDKTRFIVKYQKTLSIPEELLNQNWVFIFKNKGGINIKSTEADIKSIKIYDTLGRLLIEKVNVNSKETSIDSSKFSNQILIVTIIGIDNNELTRKIVN